MKVWNPVSFAASLHPITETCSMFSTVVIISMHVLACRRLRLIPRAEDLTLPYCNGKVIMCAFFKARLTYMLQPPVAERIVRHSHFVLCVDGFAVFPLTPACPSQGASSCDASAAVHLKGNRPRPSRDCLQVSDMPHIGFHCTCCTYGLVPLSFKAEAGYIAWSVMEDSIKACITQ